MRIDAPGEDTIIVELTSKDMNELDITYEKMDYSNIETRRVIWTLLDRAGHILGREIDPSGQLQIEAIPDKNGGCVLFINVHAQPAYVCRAAKKERKMSVLESDGIDAMLDFARAVCECDDVQNSQLYENHGRYRLIMPSHPTLERIASEYFITRQNSGVERERTCEHWHCIADKNALNVLAGKRS